VWCDAPLRNGPGDALALECSDERRKRLWADTSLQFLPSSLEDASQEAAAHVAPASAEIGKTEMCEP